MASGVWCGQEVLLTYKSFPVGADLFIPLAHEELGEHILPIFSGAMMLSKTEEVWLL